MTTAPSPHGSGPFSDLWRRGSIRRPAAAAPSPAPLLVLKVGGSLLSRPDWPGLLGPLVDTLGGGACCIVVGGGAVVDGLRLLDRAVPQTPQLMHELAIDAMRLTARMVAVAVGLPLAAAPPDSRAAAVLDVPAWLRVDARAAALPVGWHVTSDSIAARVAVEHGGSLVLAKSVSPPPCPADDLSALARAGWVDGHFPVAAASLETIEWVAPTA